MSAPAPRTPVEILDAAVELVRAAPAPLYAISLCGTVPVAVTLLLYSRWLLLQRVGVSSETLGQGIWLWSLALAAAWGLLSAVRAFLAVAVVRELEGATAGEEPLWQAGLRAAAPAAVFGLGLFGFGWLGLTLFLLPALWLFSTTWAVRPVLVRERVGLLGALRRSRALTRPGIGRLVGLWSLNTLGVAASMAGLWLWLRFLPSAVG
ncbi:MAG: hypothetical protein FJX77_16155, partial [Armatimonadetes bacterium]|nr:hypothetical protein [Armatimonadota bacterium]